MTRTGVDLTEEVKGVLPAANGGTGSSTLAGAGIEQTANKNVGNGYAGLGAGGMVAPAQLGSGSASSTTFLRGDQTYATPAGGATVDPVTVSSAATLTLTVSSTTAVQNYVYNGSAATTWTLPAVSGNTGKRLILENSGSTSAAVITLNRAGTDNLWFLSALTSITVSQGGSLLLVCDGTYWQVLSTDVAHDVVGILPVANGGIGAATLTGLAKGNGTAAFTAASAGTDYSVPTGVETLTNKTLTSPTVNTPAINGYTEGVSTVTVGATQTISLASATVFVYTLTTATACTFTMPTAVAGKSFTVILKQPAAGTVTTATFTAVKWNAAGTPTITATLGRADILSFFSDGTNWYGSYSQGYTY